MLYEVITRLADARESGQRRSVTSAKAGDSLKKESLKVLKKVTVNDQAGKSIG